MAAKIRIAGLTRLEQLELSDQLPPGEVETSVETSTVAGQHGDLATVAAVVSASMSVLSVLAAWLEKRRKQPVVVIEIEAPDGGWRHCSVRMDLSGESPVLQQLTQLVQPTD